MLIKECSWLAVGEVQWLQCTYSRVGAVFSTTAGNSAKLVLVSSFCFPLLSFTTPVSVSLSVPDPATACIALQFKNQSQLHCPKLLLPVHKRISLEPLSRICNEFDVHANCVSLISIIQTCMLKPCRFTRCRICRPIQITTLPGEPPSRRWRFD